MKSTTTNIFFNQQKTEFGDALYIFLSFHLFIFFCSSCLFCLQASTEDYKDMHLRFVVHLMFLLWTSFYFWFLKQNGTVLYVFYLDLMVSWLHLMFQVFKCLKWRVQPQSSVLTPQKLSLEMLYIFFWAIFYSSSSVHHVSFVCRLQLKITKTCIWDLSFILCLFCGYLFFFAFWSELIWFFMFFYWDLRFLGFILCFRILNAWNELYNHKHLF